jgi:hypothetical protein
MKPLTPFIIPIACLLVSCSQKDRPESAVSTGRFQIVPATATQLNEATVHVVLKIDTVTGKTWRYQSGPIGTGLPAPKSFDAYGWQEVSESFSESYRVQDKVVILLQFQFFFA